MCYLCYDVEKWDCLYCCVPNMKDSKYSRGAQGWTMQHLFRMASFTGCLLSL